VNFSHVTESFISCSYFRNLSVEACQPTFPNPPIPALSYRLKKKIQT
jgi:hypothetical protein